MIVTEEPPKSLAATDGAVSTRWCKAFWRNQPIVKTLVIPFSVIVRRECGERSTQVGFAEDDDPIQAPLFNRPHEALRIRIAVGRLDRRPHDANAGVGQGPSEGGPPLGVTVTEEVVLFRCEQGGTDFRIPGRTLDRTVVNGDCSARCSKVDISVDRSSGESCLPGVRRLNEMWRNTGGALLPFARRGQSAERAGRAPLFRRVRGPGGGPGAGVAPVRGTLEQRRSRATFARESVHDFRSISGRNRRRTGRGSSVRSLLRFASEVVSGSHDCDPRKGFKSRRSLSPVTITFARPFTAASRNLSSFGSRDARIVCRTSMISTSDATRSSSASRRSRCT